MTFRDPRNVLKENGLWTKKKFGQNFLIDAFVIEHIISVSGAQPTDIAFEIGAGCGTLTTFISPHVEHLTSIEYDRDLIPVLEKELHGYNNVEIKAKNALDLDWNLEAKKVDRSLMLFGNLPYHLSSEIILALINAYGSWRRACFMVQKEFGERLAASAGTRNSSALSVQLELLAYTSVAFSVPPHAFVPPPKVDSCVIVIEPRATPALEIEFLADFKKVVKALFGQRRKMARKALKVLNLNAETLLNETGLDGRRRGESFTLNELISLTKKYAEMTKP